MGGVGAAAHGEQQDVFAGGTLEGEGNGDAVVEACFFELVVREIKGGEGLEGA